MTYCYTPIDSPAFFYANGGCGELNHDIIVKDGDLATTTQNEVNNIISAVLIQLHTDQVYEGERGFWGDEFMGFNLGNHLWRMSLTTTKDNVSVRAEAMIRQAIDPLIDQGLIDDIIINTVQVVGGVDATVDIIKNGQSIFKSVV